MNAWWWLDEANVALLVLLATAALRWGAAPERWSVGALVAMQVVDWLYHWVVGRGAFYHSMDVGHFAIDSAAAAGFLLLAVQANRIYPLCLAALQLTSVLMHLARAAEAQVAGFAYALLAYAPFYVEVLVIAIGIALHARRKRRRGSYRSWRTSSHRSPETPRSR